MEQSALKTPKGLRQAFGMNQEEWARILKVDRASWSHVETSRRDANMRQMTAMQPFIDLLIKIEELEPDPSLVDMAGMNEKVNEKLQVEFHKLRPKLLQARKDLEYARELYATGIRLITRLQAVVNGELKSTLPPGTISLLQSRLTRLIDVNSPSACHLLQLDVFALEGRMKGLCGLLGIEEEV